MDLPSMNELVQKGIKGQNYFQNLVTGELDCQYFSVSQEYDYGIDGYIMVVNNHKITGEMVAVQIKYGDSYFKKKVGNKYKFYDSKIEHLNYYINQDIPVYLVLIDDKFKRIIWKKIESEQIKLYDSDSWSIEVPEKNDVLTTLYNEIHDENNLIKNNMKIQYDGFFNSFLENTDFCCLAILKKDIEVLNLEPILSIIRRYSSNTKNLSESANSLAIFFPEYSEDEREIFQIPEIMKYLKYSIDCGIPWFYFISLYDRAFGLNFLIESYCPSYLVKIIGNNYLMSYDSKELEYFMFKSFDNLNKFIEEHNLNEHINEDITKKLLQIL